VYAFVQVKLDFFVNFLGDCVATEKRAQPVTEQTVDVHD
jgi:hypothetical protein